MESGVETWQIIPIVLFYHYFKFKILQPQLAWVDTPSCGNQTILFENSTDSGLRNIIAKFRINSSCKNFKYFTPLGISSKNIGPISLIHRIEFFLYIDWCFSKFSVYSHLPNDNNSVCLPHIEVNSSKNRIIHNFYPNLSMIELDAGTR